MNGTVARYPDTGLHVVLDNFNTHKPKHDRWLARHPKIHFHYTPTHASWLNQIEVWFSILPRVRSIGSALGGMLWLLLLVRRLLSRIASTWCPWSCSSLISAAAQPAPGNVPGYVSCLLATNRPSWRVTFMAKECLFSCNASSTSSG